MRYRVLCVSMACWLVLACVHVVPYDQVSYQQATALKAESLLLMEKAVGPPDPQQIEALTLRLHQAYEYERGKQGPNALTVNQWALLLDPKRDLLGGFLARWQSGVPLSPAFVQEKRRQVALAFDQIIQLEQAKVRE